MKVVKKFTAIALATLMFSLSACGNSSDKNSESSSERNVSSDSSVNQDSGSQSSADKESESSSAEITPSGAVKKYPDAKKVTLNGNYTQNENILKNSLLGTGNKERMQNVLDKAASGEPITVAFIGGSITYGYKVTNAECFATLYCNWLTEQFGTKVNIVNAGISGTPSVLGNLRVERDVLKYDPDLVFIEFAVNDGYEDVYKNSYESLINKVLEYKTEPAVMLLFTITREGHSCQPWMSEIGKHYELPMVSVPDSIMAEVKAGNITYDDYSNDETHPNKQGHIWIRELLSYCTEQIYNSDFETKHYTIPEKPYYKRYYKDLQLYTYKTLNVDSYGTFRSSKKNLDFFPDGMSYDYSATGENDPLVFTADCRILMIVYRQVPKSSDKYGAINVYVDDELVQTIYAQDASGWNNAMFNVAYETVTSKEHTIKICAKEGYEEKQFDILGIAYSK